VTNTAVFGTAVRYKWSDIRNFVVSLRSNGYDDDIVLFTKWFDEPEQKKMDEWGVRWVYGVAAHPVQFFARRWYWYVDELPKYERVFIADTRDTVFQDNIKYYLKDGLHVTEEAITVAEEMQSNGDWLLKYYGQDILDRCLPHPILCAGTIWGDSESLLQWCQFVMTQGDKMDQAMLNYAVRSDLLHCKIHPNGDTVWTLGVATGLYQYRFDEGVLYVDGKFAPAIHQYDRQHLGIAHYLNGLYGGY